MANKNPWESGEFTDFINEINELLELILQPAIGSDSLNRKF